MQRQGDHYEFEVSLICIVSFRPARATQVRASLKKTKKKQQNCQWALRVDKTQERRRHRGRHKVIWL